jgi:hypothetical protein
MHERLTSKQDQPEVFQIVPNTYRNHNPASELQIPTILNCYGPMDKWQFVPRLLLLLNIATYRSVAIK